MDSPIFFDGTDNLIRVVVTTPVLYIAIILFIRLSGKRSTSQMNSFDWIVTVAMGSLVASSILLKDVTVAETLLGIALLLGLQWVLTTLVCRFKPMTRLVKAEPTLLMRNGEFLRAAMRRERVTEEEVVAAVRGYGIEALDEARWVILETDATISVIARAEADNPATAMRDVRGASNDARERG